MPRGLETGASGSTVPPEGGGYGWLLRVSFLANRFLDAPLIRWFMDRSPSGFAIICGYAKI